MGARPGRLPDRAAPTGVGDWRVEQSTGHSFGHFVRMRAGGFRVEAAHHSSLPPESRDRASGRSECCLAMAGSTCPRSAARSGRSRHQLTSLLLFTTLIGCSDCAFTAAARRHPSAVTARAATAAGIPVWHSRAKLVMDESSAVADAPASDGSDSSSSNSRPDFGRGGRGNGRGRGGGRGRGESVVLLNPMYLKRKAPVFQQRSSPQRDGGGRGSPMSRPSFSADGFGGGPPSDGDDDSGRAASRARSFGADKKKAVGASAWEKPKRGAEGAATRGKEKRGKRIFEADDGLAAGALSRAPRKKGKAGKRGAAAPVEPVGPPQVTLVDAITVGELASQLRVGAAEVVKDLMKMGIKGNVCYPIYSHINLVRPRHAPHQDTPSSISLVTCLSIGRSVCVNLFY